MTETKYRVQSLERGLAILRQLRASDGPVRNQDLVNGTGLPKATVSRLLSTLDTLGYVRRIDQGSYVLASASARSGRSLLGALKLQDHSDLFAYAPGTVYLEALVSGEWVAVYRWSAQGAGAISIGSMPSEVPGGARKRGDDDRWDAHAQTWWCSKLLTIAGVGNFSLTLLSPRTSPPSAQESVDLRAMLREAAGVLAQKTETS